MCEELKEDTVSRQSLEVDETEETLLVVKKDEQSDNPLVEDNEEDLAKTRPFEEPKEAKTGPSESEARKE